MNVSKNGVCESGLTVDELKYANTVPSLIEGVTTISTAEISTVGSAKIGWLPSEVKNIN